MLATVLPFVGLMSAVFLLIPAVLVSWSMGRDGRKSRELYSLYRQVVASRGEHGRQWAMTGANSGGHGLEAAELRDLIVSRQSR